jgi:DNA-directed RNA polymerase specialized sigma24 family protein
MPAQELERLLGEALGTLNVPQRLAIEKVMFEGLTLREVAEQAGES